MKIGIIGAGNIGATAETAARQSIYNKPMAGGEAKAALSALTHAHGR